MKIIIGLSGGVDSAVAALLLKEQGHDVRAIFMRNWDQQEGDDNDCPADIDQQDAEAICEQLDIDFQIVNFSRDYWDRVFQYFLDEYAAGRTPNPDVMCNTEIKFKAFLDYAMEQGADKIATGHYVQTRESNGRVELIKGIDPRKDQSYFLHGLNQTQLSKSVFPLGGMLKSDVRKIAEKAGFKNAAKKDSTGICFIGERKFKSFLQQYLLAQPGDMVTPDGKIMGKHDGLMFYTIGQRQGLNIGGIKDGDEKPWYVADKNIETKALIVVQGYDHPALFSDSLTCESIHWISGEEPVYPLKCSAKIRHLQPEQDCVVSPPLVTFKQPQRGIAPGQYVVFYDGDVCLGGGVIS